MIKKSMGDIQWKKLTVTPLSETKYHVVFEGEDARGEGEMEVTEEHTLIELGHSLRDEYNCEVVIERAEGSDPKRLVFCKEQTVNADNVEEILHRIRERVPGRMNYN